MRLCFFRRRGTDARPIRRVSALLALALLASHAHLAQAAAPAPTIDLPATNMSGDTSVYREISADLARLAASLPGDGGVAENPGAPGATPIGTATCSACHTQEQLLYSHTTHARAFAAGSGGASAVGSCESCHGPGSLHAGSPTTKGAIISFTHEGGTPVQTQTQACMGCHTGGARQHWLSSVHETRGLSCSDCHNPMARGSPEGLMAKRSINETCAGCHQDVRAKFNRRSHMPLPEGQMSCADCHNPHGSVTKPLLKTDTANGTCYGCHAERRGPMLFEHPPVRENCMNCHDPHGSNQQTLLAAPVPMLCQQCHTAVRHPNDLQTPAGLANGGAPDERLISRACLSCHTTIHGSNNAAGAKFHR
ncbi:MAG: DmsE family decaheme c-type cytochrome [Nevskiaceae bacterium]|nr:DmsE family decaheme c-type cytochrome [Nevskiaceae bacterium]